MHLLELISVEKIYVSDGNASIGIRNASISLDLRELVFITGQSGAGKTTLLNILGGIDPYDEGALLIEGQSTRLYSEKDWADYNRKYISMISQQYYLVDSFTVLENIELVLVGKETEKEKRKNRCFDLLKKVGMDQLADRKVAQLSGGQKQRVAIARALAMDRPILIADEPTYNLDEDSSTQIMCILKEIAQTKLVIVVSHKADDVERYASREIRIRDGAIEYDKVIHQQKEKVLKSSTITNTNNCSYKVGDAWRLGLKMWKSKPRLTIFLTVLLSIAMLGSFVFWAVLRQEVQYLVAEKSSYYDENVDRMVLISKDGLPFSNELVESIAENSKATRFIQCDILCDNIKKKDWLDFVKNKELNDDEIPVLIDQNLQLGKLDVGRYPQLENECVLYLPYSVSDYFGRKEINVSSIMQNKIEYKVVGIKYFFDNNNIGRMMLTEDGYKIASLMEYIGQYLYAEVVDADNISDDFEETQKINVGFSFDLDKRYIFCKSEKNYSDKLKKIIITGNNPDLNEETTENKLGFEMTFSAKQLLSDTGISNGDVIMMNPYAILEQMQNYADNHYPQCSLWINGDENKERLEVELNEKGYLAIPTDSISKMTGETFVNGFAQILLILGIGTLGIVLMGIFVIIGVNHIIELSRQDMLIFKYIGIKDITIRRAYRSRMIYSLVLATLLLLGMSQIVYSNALCSKVLCYLHIEKRILIILAVIVLSLYMLNKKMRKIMRLSINADFLRCNNR